MPGSGLVVPQARCGRRRIEGSCLHDQPGYAPVHALNGRHVPFAGPVMQGQISMMSHSARGWSSLSICMHSREPGQAAWLSQVPAGTTSADSSCGSTCSQSRKPAEKLRQEQLSRSLYREVLTGKQCQQVRCLGGFARNSTSPWLLDIAAAGGQTCAPCLRLLQLRAMLWRHPQSLVSCTPACTGK